MPRLAHLSDIHITTPTLEWTRSDWFNKRLAAWMNFRWLGRARYFRHADQVLSRLMQEISQRNIDRVLLSGDATALGFPGEMEQAGKLLQVSGLSGLAIPGNHDYCTIPAAASGAFEKVFAPWLQGERLEEDIYPFAQRVGDIWLIGVNTSTGNRWAWDAGGAAGESQRRRLAHLLEGLEPGPRILVTHFPVCLSSGKPERRFRGLRDLPEVVEIAARGGVALWLHGHRHAPYYFQQSPLSPFPIICAGSSTQTGLWSYGEYTIDGDRLQALRRVYNPAKDQFEDAESFDLALHVK